MINPLELSHLLDKTRRRKTTKDPIAPWIVGAMSWGCGIYCQKSIGVLPAAAPPQRDPLYRAVVLLAPCLIAAIIALGLALSLWTIAVKRRRRRAKRHPLHAAAYAHWALLAFSLGLLAARPIPIASPQEFVPCTIAAIIDDIQPGTTQATIKITEYRHNGISHVLSPPPRARMTLTQRELSSLRIGTTFQANGHFTRYEGPSVPGAFDASTWAKNTGLSGFFVRQTRPSASSKKRESKAYEPPEPDPLFIDDMPDWTLSSWLNAKRRAAFDLLQPHSSVGILPALILGSSRTIDNATREDFSRLGIAHVLAVSGMHFGIIAVLIVTALRWAISRIPFVMRRWGRRRLSLLLTFPILLVYLLFVDAPVSAQRALLMLAMCNLGQITGKKCDKMRAFLFAAVVITAINPNAVFSVSFQLSFSAVLGIIWCTDFYSKYCQIRILSLPLPRRMTQILDSLAAALLVVIATSMTTAPFVLYHFGQLPLLGSLANLIVVPWVTFVLMPALIIAAAAIIADLPLSDFVVEIAQRLENYTRDFAGYANDVIPMACVDVLPNLALSFATAAVVCCIWIRPHAAPWRICLAVVPTIALSAFIAAFAVTPQTFTKPEGIRMTFVSMGQADATLIEFPNGQNMLVDSGAEVSRRANATQNQLIPFLKRRGIRTIDILVLTHWDYDHVAGLPHLLEQKSFEIREIWHNGFAPNDARWNDVIAQSGVAAKNVQLLPAERAFGNANVQILWPHPIYTAHLLGVDSASQTDPDAFPTIDDLAFDPNDASIVLRVSLGRFSALLMGDAPKAVERQIMLTAPQLTSGATILKAGHHGSKTASSEAYIDHVKPRYAVFSVGKNNRYRFPHFNVETTFFERKTKMLRTDTHGSVQIVSDGRAVRVSTMYR